MTTVTNKVGECSLFGCADNDLELKLYLHQSRNLHNLADVPMINYKDIDLILIMGQLTHNKFTIVHFCTLRRKVCSFSRILKQNIMYLMVELKRLLYCQAKAQLQVKLSLNAMEWQGSVEDDMMKIERYDQIFVGA